MPLNNFSAKEGFGVRFGRLIKHKRGLESLTQENLAELVYSDPDAKTRISELENGRILNPQQKTIDAFVVALNILPEEIERCYAENDSRLAELESDRIETRINNFLNELKILEHLVHIENSDLIDQIKALKSELGDTEIHENPSKWLDLRLKFAQKLGLLGAASKDKSKLNEAANIARETKKALSDSERIKVKYLDRISKSRSFKSALDSFERMVRREYSIDANIINRLLKKCGSREEIRYVYDYFEILQVKPNLQTFKFIFEKAISLGEFEFWKNEITEHVVQQNFPLLMDLAKHADRSEQVQEIYKQIVKNNIKPTIDIFEMLIRLSENHFEAKYWFEELKKFDLSPNLAVIINMIEKSENFDTANRYLQELQKYEIEPDYNAIVALMEKAQKSNSAEKLFDEIEKMKLASTS